MRVLVGCESSGRVRDAFLALGHDAWSCDLKPTEQPGPHLQCDIMQAIKKYWDLLIAHPDCTFLTNSSNRHLYAVPSVNGRIAKISGIDRWREMHLAGRFFKRLWNADIDQIALENPLPHGWAIDIIGPYTQIIHPWQFGHGEQKRTCLWLKNLPLLKPTNIVAGREQRIWKMSPGDDRKTNRSRTYQGIADAMASQWGDLNGTK